MGCQKNAITFLKSRFSLKMLGFLMDLWKSWQIAVTFVGCLLSVRTAGAQWLPAMGMVCAKGCESATVPCAVHVPVCCRTPAKTHQRTQGKILHFPCLGSDPTGPKAALQAL